MRFRGGTWRCVWLCAIVGSTGISTPASAQPVPGAEIARAAFEEGVALEKRGEYAAALLKFSESAKIRETSGVLFHRAYCMEMSKQDLVVTVEAYEKAERAATKANQASILSAVKRQIGPLTEKLAHVTITVTPRPARDLEVWLDGRLLPLALLGKSFRADPGEHNVEAKAPGFKPFRKAITPGHGATLTIDVVLDRAPGAASAHAPPVAPPANDAPAVEPPAEEKHGRSIALPLLLTGGAVVLAGAGVGAFLAAGGKQEDARAECATRIECDDLRRGVGTLDALALTAWIGAAGLGTWATIAWLSKGPKAASRRAPGATQVFVGPLGLAVRGSWQ